MDKHEKKKQLHTHQMNNNKKERNQIQLLKDTEKAAALQELLEFKNNIQSMEHLVVKRPECNQSKNIKLSSFAKCYLKFHDYN